MADRPEKNEKPDKADRSEKSGGGDKGDKAAKATRAAAEAARDRAAEQFKALGDPTRLRILDLLRAHAATAALARAGRPSPPPHLEGATPPDEEDAETYADDGSLTVGAISVGIGGKEKGSSTLSHHLKELRQAGLIVVKRRGKNQMCRIDGAAVERLRCYLWVPTAPPCPDAADEALARFRGAADADDTDRGENDDDT